MRRGVGKEDGLQTFSLNSFTALLPLRTSQSQASGLHPTSFTFFPQKKNMAECGISLEGCKMGLD